MPPAHRTIRSSRRSLALQITEEGLLVIRAPRFLSDRAIAKFLEEKSGWIEKKVREAAERAKTALPPPDAAAEKELKERARDAFIERSCFYAAKMGVRFKKIRLNSARTRWGSCGPTGNLSFNWRLIQAPVEILDYVVVHELAHLIEHNHSKRFWGKVAEFNPDYRVHRAWLKKHRL